MDRQLPMALPFMSEDGGETGSGSHPARYDMSGKRTVVISTCGFYTAEGNYDGVGSLFDHICGKGQYTALFCGQGELFRVPELKQRTEEYLGYVRQAGREYMGGGITGETGGGRPLTRPGIRRATRLAFGSVGGPPHRYFVYHMGPVYRLHLQNTHSP